MKTIKAVASIFLLSATVYAEAQMPLRIFAAAGTAPAMREIAKDYTKETGTPIIFNFANAGVLAKQICAGAEFDLFFSANEKWIDYVEHKGLVDASTRTDLLENELVIIVPKGRPATIDLSQPFKGRFAIGDQSTPLGIYAKEAFTEMGCWESLQPHLCAGDTVNKALNYVSMGEADAGVVFRSVAFCASNRVDIAFAIPQNLHQPIRFPIAAARASPESVAFIRYLQSSTALETFKKYGWTPCTTKKSQKNSNRN